MCIHVHSRARVCVFATKWTSIARVLSFFADESHSRQMSKTVAIIIQGHYVVMEMRLEEMCENI
jgi:hypothetical protein